MRIAVFRAPRPAAVKRSNRARLFAMLTFLATGTAVGQQPRLPDAATRLRQAQRFVAERTSRNGSATALQQARAQHLTLLQATQANLTAAWQPLGPAAITTATFGSLTGRVTAIAVDPSDTSGNTVYLGTADGGVWKSTNAAGTLSSVSFAPLTDTLPVFSPGGTAIASLSIGAVAVQPQANPVLLAGTGDPNDATDSLYGEGLLRSTDGGLTWTLVQGSRDGANGNHSWIGLATAAIAFSTATPSTVVTAMSTSAQGVTEKAAPTSAVPGLYYSTDAGVTWQMATLYDGAAVVQQPVPAGTPQAANAATAVVWDGLRQRFYAAVRGHGYYSSPDGATWTRLTAQPGTGLTTANCPVGINGAGSTSCPIFRGALAVQPATGDLYALTVDAQNNDQGLWQDLCAATGTSCANAAPVFANRIDGGALEVGSGSTQIVQGGYDLALAAAPVIGGTTLYAGTIDIYRCALPSGSSACALRNTTNALNGCNAPAKVAPAQHALATFGSAPLVFAGNDGGLWRSTDGIAQTGAACSVADAAHFDNLNPAIGVGGSLAQIVGLAQDPADANTLLAGLGANGSAATTAASALNSWPQLSAGEGGYPLLDPTTPTNWTLAIGAAVNFKRCTLGGNCTATDFAPPSTIGEPQVSQDAALEDAPALLDPAATNEMLVATCRIWRGPAGDGATWSAGNAISPPFDGAVSSTPCTAANSLVRSVAAGGPASLTGSTQNQGSTVLYAGIAGKGTGGATGIAGHVFVTQHADTAAASVAWTDIATSAVTNDTANAGLFNPLGFDITSLTVDTHDATGATVYATLAGFGAPHLYRSTDFGAHWLNLSANLPNAPANALAIDPSDANTVYLALDTGVYVTRQIATCTTANCWSVLGTGLPNAPVTQLAAGAALPTGDGRTGELRAGTYGRGLWQTPLLTAASSAKPAITLSATSFDFGSVTVGATSSTQTLTITSSGNAPVTFGTPTITPAPPVDFTETDTCAGKTLAVGQTCTVTLTFTPTATGARSGTLTLFANITGGQAQVTLTGNGTPAAQPATLVLTPTSLTFAATIVNQASAAQNLTIANTGGTAATLQPPTLTGDFTLTATTCKAALAAQDSCTVSIAFTPTAAGARSGTFSITDSAGTQAATLTGTGEANATDTLAPTALTFPQQQIGTSGTPQTVTLTNSGDVPLTLIAASVPAGDFSVVSACGNSLAPHATCALQVTFTPTASGTRSAILTITDQFRSQTVSLTGTGIAGPGVSLTPQTLTFAATGAGQVSAAQTVTLTNNGGLPLTITSTTVAGPFAIAATTCGSSLAAGSACTLSLVFAPTVGGVATGSLVLTDNATGTTTQTVALSGTGVDFTLTANGATSVTVPSGTSATYGLLLSSAAGLSGTVTLACTGAPAHSVCTVAPATAALGGTQTITVTVQTGLAKAGLPVLTTAAFVLGGFLLALTLRRRKLSVVLMLALSLSALNGCGAGRVNPEVISTPVPTPTPSGTYNLTVTGTAAGLSRSVALTLVVP